MDTPALQATPQTVCSEKTLPMNEECFLDEKYSLLDTPSIEKDNVNLTKEQKKEGLAINQTLVTGAPQEFKDEV